VSVTGNVNGGNVNTGTLSLSGNVLTSIRSTSNITTTGNIAGTYFLGNGSQLSGIAGGVPGAIIGAGAGAALQKVFGKPTPKTPEELAKDPAKDPAHIKFVEEYNKLSEYFFKIYYYYNKKFEIHYKGTSSYIKENTLYEATDEENKNLQESIQRIKTLMFF
jgi:hypothetical protein